MKLQHFLCAASIFALPIHAAAQPAFPNYVVTGLPVMQTSSGSVYLQPNVIDNQGLIYGTMNGQSYRYNPATDTLTTMPLEVAKVNASGTVLGSVYLPDQFGRQYPATWTQSSGLRLLGDFNYAAADINNNGEIVGRSNNTPVFWNQAGNASFMQLPFVGDFGGANGINSSGVIVGASSYRGALLWRNPSAAPEVLQNPAGFSGYAVDINDSGLIAGGVGSISTDEVRACVWDMNGSLQYIAPNGGRAFTAGVSNNGIVTGSRANLQGVAQRAFLWSQSTGYSELNALRDPSSLTWSLITSHNINDNGWVVGLGIVNGRFRGYLARPVPEPASMSALAIGVFMLRRRSKAQKKTD